MNYESGIFAEAILMNLITTEINFLKSAWNIVSDLIDKICILPVFDYLLYYIPSSRPILEFRHTP